MHSCDQWGDSIDGNCEVCHVRDTNTESQDPIECHVDTTQEAYEEEAVAEAIATPIYGRYGELRSKPCPPTQSGAGRKDIIHQKQPNRDSRNDGGHHYSEDVAAPSGAAHESKDSNALAGLKPPTNSGMQTESSDHSMSSKSEPARPGQRLPAWSQHWLSSTVSEQHWPSDGGDSHVSSTMQRTLQPDPASGTTVERQVLHRKVGDKEIRDILTVRHEPQDKEPIPYRASTHQAAVFSQADNVATPQREMKNIETNEELAEFEQHFSDSSTTIHQDLLHQLRSGRYEDPHFESWHNSPPVQVQKMQSQHPSTRESPDALLRLLGLVLRSPVSADGEYDGTNDAMTMLREVAACL